MTDLTEQYKQKQLKWYEEYYVDLENNGDIKKLYLEDDWCFYDGIVDHDLKHNPYMVVYDKVPSYEEWVSARKFTVAGINATNEIAQLKELLKECKGIFDECFSPSAKHGELYKKIDEVLK